MRTREAFASDFDSFVIIYAKAHGRKCWLRHQAGMRRQVGFAPLERPGLDRFKQTSEQAAALGGRPNVGKIDIAAWFDRHEAQQILSLFGDQDLLFRQASVPGLALARVRRPGARLRVCIFRRPIVDRIEHHLAERVIVRFCGSANPGPGHIHDEFAPSG